MHRQSICFGFLAALLSCCFVSTAQAQAAPVAPRSASELIALLRDYQPDPKRLAELRARADRPVPADAQGRSLIAFYHERGRAARALGRAGQMLADLRKAAELAAPANSGNVRLMDELAVAEGNSGNPRNSLEIRTRNLQFLTDPGWRTVSFANIASSQAFAGDVASAEASFKQAEQQFAMAMTDRNTLVWHRHSLTGALENNRFFLLVARGKFAEAEAACRRSIDGWTAHIPVRRIMPSQQDDAPIEFYEFLLGRQELFLSTVVGVQGRHAEAEAIARDVLNRWLARIGGGANEVGFAVTAVGRAVFSQGRFTDAQQIARAAIAIQQKAGADSESRFIAGARDVLGSSLAALRNWQEAATVYEERNAALAREPSMAYWGWNVNWALALVKLGRSVEALPMLDRLADLYLARTGSASYAVAEVRGVRAMARAASGQPREALAEFREALPVLLAASDESASETTSRSAKDVRIRIILESYLELLLDGAGEAPRTRERLDEAFRIADFLRSQSVQRSVTASAARAAVQDPELAAVVRKEQDLANEVTALYAAINRIISAPPDQQLPKVVADMRARIERIREERTALRQSIERRFPSFANLINPRPPTLDDAQRVLRTGEVLVATLTMERRTLVWSVPATGMPAFHDAALGEGELAALVGGLRRAFDVHGGSVPAYDVDRAYELYRRVLQPLEASWQGARHLLVATEGALAQLPFALLVTRANDDRAARELEFDQYRSVEWLIRQAAITQIPTVNSIVTLRGLPAGKPGRMAFVGFGDPIFAKVATPQQDAPAAVAGGAPVSLRSASKGLGLASSRLEQLPRLPDTADEILGIAKSLGANADADVFLRTRATEREVMKQDLSNRRVIAFATHGLVPGELDGLTQPALALTAPEVDGVDGDGLLTLEKILGLKLDADWVVLSACNTASGDGAGAEAVSGLGRAFFYAGTRALLVSNWPVETVSARLLTTGIFERQAKDSALTRAEALRQTMLDLMQNGVARGAEGKAAYRYAHPLFWAPFSLVGDGG